MGLFHFSEDPELERFTPRPVRVPAQRRPGQEWLNGPLVWAIEESHQRLYLFPRECPRIVIWASETTTPEDRRRWLGGLPEGSNAVAWIERAWLGRFESGILFRYELPNDSFTDLDDAGMRVSPDTVVPIAVTRLVSLHAALENCGTALRVVDSLVPFRHVWQSSVHASGIRLRNAAGWSG